MDEDDDWVFEGILGIPIEELEMDENGPPTYTVSWSHAEGCYVAVVEGKTHPRATGDSAEEALFNLRHEMKEAFRIKEAWKGE